MPDDPGVLGNLPRSRPGRRSEKRGGGAWSEAAGAPGAAGGAAEPAKRQAARKPAARKTTAAKSGPARSKTASTRSGAARKPAQPRPPAAEERTSTDPVSGAIRAAGGLAEAGVKTAVNVAGAVFKRLPRP